MKVELCPCLLSTYFSTSDSIALDCMTDREYIMSWLSETIFHLARVSCGGRGGFLVFYGGLRTINGSCLEVSRWAKVGWLRI